MVANVVALLDRLNLPGWATALLALSLAGLLAILVRSVLEILAKALAKHRAPHAAELLSTALRGPVTVLLFLLGIELALAVAELPPSVSAVPRKAVGILTIFVAAYGFGRGLLAVLRAYTPLSTRLSPLQGFLSGLVKGLVAFLAVLVALDSVGISITPILASLGVGSVAVALALQETLGNFFAGISILADHPVRVGDYVKIDPDLEGQVLSIGWRTSTILEFSQNLAIIPNATLARSIVRNYSRPEAAEVVPVKVLVEHDSQVSAALAAVSAVVEPLGGSAVVSGIGPSGIELTIDVPAESRIARRAVRSRVLTELAEALQKAGVKMSRYAAPPPAEHGK